MKSRHFHAKMSITWPVGAPRAHGLERGNHMDISKVTVKELLANQAACDAMNAIDPKILKSPMVKLVKGKTVEAVFNMVPDSKASPEIKQKIRDALAAI